MTEIICLDCAWSGESEELTCDNDDEKRVIHHHFVKYNLCPVCKSYNIENNYKENGKMKTKSRTYNTAYDGRDPHVKMMCDVVLRAIEDLNHLKANHIIEDFKVCDEWPLTKAGRPRKFLHEYSKRYQVQELLDFFKENWVIRMLNALGGDVSGVAMMEKINVKKSCAQF